MCDAIYSIWLSNCNKIGTARAKALIEYFGSAQNVYNASESQLRDIDGLRQNISSQLINKDLAASEKIMEACNKIGCTVIGLSDSEYPERLRNIFDPPTVLYIRGILPKIDDNPVVGVVGTRHCTPYGIKHAESTGQKLSASGVTVVTGLARGIDAAAARGALQGDTPMIGVIGTGVDIAYPAQNKALYKEVLKSGAIVSEYPPGTPVLPGHFPARNRIISGLSNGVAVIEAPVKSGALITAERALEQGRDVFSLPGNVDALACIGSNKLLRDGAIPFLSADDIIDEYKDLFDGIKKPFDNTVAVDYIDLDKLSDKLDGNSKIIAMSIGFNLVDTADIIANTGLDAQSVLSSLTLMELDGYLRRDLIGRWEIVR
ncbi:MAG: DNA-processing protein DprA [Oscillospiraceae bacterium]|nr:DNA-processing protein DprA [Oscillospiraceae bacterium]